MCKVQIRPNKVNYMRWVGICVGSAAGMGMGHGEAHIASGIEKANKNLLKMSMTKQL